VISAVAARSASMSATPAQMHELLASSLSCLARLAMLGASPLAGALQQAADREARDAAAVDHAEDQPSLRLGDDWKTMRQARKALDKISDSLDSADVPAATAIIMQMCTSIIHRHNQARKQFFTTGRGSSPLSSPVQDELDDPELAVRCAEAVELLDAVAPQIRNHFQKLADEDDKLKAIEFVEIRQREQHEHRLERIAKAEAKGRAKQERKQDSRRRAKEQHTRALAEEMIAQREARTQYDAYHDAKSTRHKGAEQRVSAARREKYRLLKMSRKEDEEAAEAIVARATASRAAKLGGGEAKLGLGEGGSDWNLSPVAIHKSPVAMGGQLPPMVQLRKKMEIERVARSTVELDKKLASTWSSRQFGVGINKMNSGAGPSAASLLMCQKRRTSLPATITTDVDSPGKPDGHAGSPQSPERKERKKKIKETPHCLPLGDDGEPVTAWQIVTSSDVLNKRMNDRKAPVTTLLAVISPSAQKWLGGDSENQDEIDIEEISELTGLSAFMLNNYLALYTAEQRQSNRPMKVDHFKRLMRKLNFTNNTLTARMFEVFDSNHNGAISFTELMMGISFFVEHSNSEEKSFHDPLLVEYMTRFFDLDASDSLCMFDLYKILQVSFAKEWVQPCTEALWDVISNGNTGVVTYIEFEKRTQMYPNLKRVLHRIMILQGTKIDSAEYKQQMDPILALTEQWRNAKATGRINALDELAKLFMSTSDTGDRAALAFTADTMAAIKKGDESVIASYYVKVMRMIIDHGASYMSKELSSIVSKIDKFDKKLAVAEMNDSIELNEFAKTAAKLQAKKSVISVFMGAA